MNDEKIIKGWSILEFRRISNPHLRILLLNLQSSVFHRFKMFLPLQPANAHGANAGPPPVVEQYMDRPVVKPFQSTTVIPVNTQPIDTAALANHDDTETAGPPLSPVMQSECSAATKLKQMIQGSSDLIVCPGVYDGFSARIALAVGFSAMYMVCCPSLM